MKRVFIIFLSLTAMASAKTYEVTTKFRILDMIRHEKSNTLTKALVSYRAVHPHAAVEKIGVYAVRLHENVKECEVTSSVWFDNEGGLTTVYFTLEQGRGEFANCEKLIEHYSR